mgnify:CR=1 FL=1
MFMGNCYNPCNTDTYPPTNTHTYTYIYMYTVYIYSILYRIYYIYIYIVHVIYCNLLIFDVVSIILLFHDFMSKISPPKKVWKLPLDWSEADGLRSTYGNGEHYATALLTIQCILYYSIILHYILYYIILYHII